MSHSLNISVHRTKLLISVANNAYCLKHVLNLLALVACNVLVHMAHVYGFSSPGLDITHNLHVYVHSRRAIILLGRGRPCLSNDQFQRNVFCCFEAHREL